MHPILASRERLGLYGALWVPLATLLVVLLVEGRAYSWSTSAIVSLPLAAVYAFVCLGGFYLGRAVPLSSSPRKLLPTHLGAALVSASVWLLAGHAWTTALARGGLPEAAAGFPQAAPVLFGFGVLLFLLTVALYYVMAGVQASQDAERQALTYRYLSRDAELRALRAQLQPHFLFNSLNSISALTTRDPAAARRMCLLLADVLRSSLTLGNRETIPLEQELDFVGKMLEIEKVRFGDRLSHELRVEEAARDKPVPPLLLQPLVENAITHGIAALVEGGTVRIEARVHPDRLDLVVENPRDPDAPRRHGTGVGLDSVKRRLGALYGEAGRVDVRADSAWFRVELSLPVPDAGSD